MTLWASRLSAATWVCCLCFLIGASVPGCARRVAARQDQVRGTEVAPGYGAYGYVALSSDPTSGSTRRQRAVCESFHRTFARADHFQDVPRSELMVTFWPLVHSIPEHAGCEEALAAYDFPFAQQLAAEIGRLESRGPLLVAWQGPFNRDTEGEALVLDMSDFSEADIDRAMRIWRDRIVRGPEKWRDGFRGVLFREALRNLLEDYGEHILAVIRPD